MSDEYRCVRGVGCADRQRTVDDQGIVWLLGAPVTDGPLCETCERHLGWVVGWLVVDVVDLTRHLVPSLQVRYHDPRLPAPSRMKKHPPLPLDGRMEAHRARIDHEISVWSELVADAAGVPWDTQLARAQRVGARVQAGCQLIAHRLPWLLGLPPVEYEARSSSEHPTDGYDPDQLSCDDGMWTVTRDGVDAALLLFELHRDAEVLLGRLPAEILPVPCPRCDTRALAREMPLGAGRPGRVVCRRCWRPMTDDAYEHLVAALTTAWLGGAG